MEEEIVKGEEIVAVPEEKETAQAPVETTETSVEVADVAAEIADVPAETTEPPVEVAEVPDEVSVEEIKVVNPAPDVETAAESETSEYSEKSEDSESSEAEPEEEAEEPAPLLTSGAEVIAKLKALPNYGVSIARDELERLKQAFYRWHNAAVGEVKDAFVAAGNDEEAFVPADRCPELVAEEEEFKEIMTVIREKRAEAQKELDRIREQNLLRKEAILERLKTMIDNADTVPVSYDEFLAIQSEWREIKEVPPEKASELWKTYQAYTERFYDLHKLNNMFREYDFKKNLEVKTQLCEQAERLAADPDVVGAFRQLQKLHQEYREAGPVAREFREEIWARFKEASTVINRRHQQYFEEQKRAEKECLEQKIAICEIMESIDYDALTSITKWNNKTEEVLALQAKWKTIPYGPRKQGQKFFERFRAACDVFFKRKAEFFKQTKETQSSNMEKKVAICEQIEALKDSTDWKTASDTVAALQKEWHSIGNVSKKHTETLWKRFRAACDAFYSNRNSASSSQRSEEQQNLAAKKSILTSLKELSDQVEKGVEEMSDDLGEKLHGLVADWNAVGHVPYREKDKLNSQYRTLVDRLFDKLHISESARRISSFRKRVSESVNVDRERERLLQTYERLKSELKTYENNLGFLSASSKSGNSLLAEVQRKMEKLRADAEEVLEKIKLLDKPVEPKNPETSETSEASET